VYVCVKAYVKLVYMYIFVHVYIFLCTFRYIHMKIYV